MNILTDHWGAIKERLKQNYPDLSDNDLAYVKDREEEVLLRIAEKTGVSRDELEQHVREACGTAPASAIAA